MADATRRSHSPAEDELPGMVGERSPAFPSDGL